MSNRRKRSQVLEFRKISPTEGSCFCPCGMIFQVEAITEMNLAYCNHIKRLRAVCPKCSRLEPILLMDSYPRPGSLDAGTNRIQDLLKEPNHE